MTLPSTFFGCWQQPIPNSLFRTKHPGTYFSDVLKDLSLCLIDSQLRSAMKLQVRQKTPYLPNYSRMFDRAPIFRCHGLLNICEIFAPPSSNRSPRFAAAL